VVFLANHQVAIESPLFSMLVSSLVEGVVVTIAKMEHKTGWLGRLIAHSFSYPGAIDPENIVYFDRDDKSSLLGLATQMAAAMMEQKKSILVHVEGTRALSSETRVEKISSIWSDVSLNTDSPIVPVRFAHALPRSTPERLEFPVGYGKQSFYPRQGAVARAAPGPAPPGSQAPRPRRHQRRGPRPRRPLRSGSRLRGPRGGATAPHRSHRTPGGPPPHPGALRQRMPGDPRPPPRHPRRPPRPPGDPGRHLAPGLARQMA
jgi:hypothetical protein